MGLADTVVSRQQAIESILDEKELNILNDKFTALQQQGIAEMKAQGERIASEQDLVFRHVLHLRYENSDSTLVVARAEMKTLRTEFEQLHRMRFGFISAQKKIVVESIAVEVIKPAQPSRIVNRQEKVDANANNEQSASQPDALRKCYMDGRWQSCPFYSRTALKVGQIIAGPAVILDPTSAIVVEAGWHACLSADNNLLLERRQPLVREYALGTEVDPVMLEIFNNLFMSIAEQMGLVLENTAASVNIKERLDFSCAIFDADGALVANAPHMPVHLGSMGESIKTVIRERWQRH